jgi:hypothetical protein
MNGIEIDSTVTALVDFGEVKAGDVGAVEDIQPNPTPDK